MATERRPVARRGELPSERAVPPPPQPGTEEADFLARLNEVYGEDPDPDEERLIAGMRAATRCALEREQ
jgi:hypothetical protein